MLDRHLYLIGMSGCGKSSIGRRAALETGVPFADLDDLIQKAAGMTVPEIFAAYGEEGFRRAETRMLAELTRARPMLISTGGGAVTFPVNRKIMRCWGTILLLDRSVDRMLETLRPENRPLLRDGGPERFRELYEQRMPIYRAAADLTISNDGEFADGVRILTRLLRERFGV